jgi:hypothetical protein
MQAENLMPVFVSRQSPQLYLKQEIMQKRVRNNQALYSGLSITFIMGEEH